MIHPREKHVIWIAHVSLPFHVDEVIRPGHSSSVAILRGNWGSTWLPTKGKLEVAVDHIVAQESVEK